jgi:hypothetical protein
LLCPGIHYHQKTKEDGVKNRQKYVMDKDKQSKTQQRGIKRQAIRGLKSQAREQEKTGMGLPKVQSRGHKKQAISQRKILRHFHAAKSTKLWCRQLQELRVYAQTTYNQENLAFCFQLCTVPHFVGFQLLPWFSSSLVFFPYS